MQRHPNTHSAPARPSSHYCCRQRYFKHGCYKTVVVVVVKLLVSQYGVYCIVVGAQLTKNMRHKLTLPNVQIQYCQHNVTKNGNSFATATAKSQENIVEVKCEALRKMRITYRSVNRLINLWTIILQYSRIYKISTVNVEFMFSQ